MKKTRVEENTECAKLCIGCKWLHIGENVDHNHCDRKVGQGFMHDERVNGRFNHPESLYHKSKCYDYEKK